VLAFFGLSKAFAGIVTGNLVMALLAGAIACRATMHALRPATPAVLLLLAAAATMHLRIKHQGR
jgi:uncharacterized membrane protein YoaK (UPF0700 family)